MTKRLLVLYRDAEPGSAVSRRYWLLTLNPTSSSQFSIHFTRQKHDGYCSSDAGMLIRSYTARLGRLTLNTPGPNSTPPGDPCHVPRNAGDDHHGGSLIQHLDPSEQHRRRGQRRSVPVHPSPYNPDLCQAILTEQINGK
jgi:hypothetical protein